MKNFNQWLNAVTIILLAVVLTDINVFLMRHPDHTNPSVSILIAILSLWLLIITGRSVLKKKNKKRGP